MSLCRKVGSEIIVAVYIVYIVWYEDILHKYIIAMFVVIFNWLSALTSCLFMKILSWTSNSGESLPAVQKAEKKKTNVWISDLQTAFSNWHANKFTLGKRNFLKESGEEYNEGNPCIQLYLLPSYCLCAVSYLLSDLNWRSFHLCRNQRGLVNHTVRMHCVCQLHGAKTRSRAPDSRSLKSLKLVILT